MTAARTVVIAMFMITMGAAGTAPAQQACPCVPLTKLWVAVDCDSWTCASAAVSVEGGDGSAFAVPTADHHWIVFKQVTAGGWTDSSPFWVDSFGHSEIDGAVARLSGIGDDHRPMIVSAPDGQFLVVALREPVSRRRATH